MLILFLVWVPLVNSVNRIAVMRIVNAIDEWTWRYVPTPVKSVIERSSWLKLLTIYTLLLVVLIYRFGIVGKSLFFHSESPTRLSDIDSGTQLRELIVHLAFFSVPMMIAFTFNRDNRPTQ